jgi:hypothetical protein
MVEVSGGVFEESIGGEVFLGLEEMARSIEPVDMKCSSIDRS